MMRVSDTELLRLLRGALRAGDLEDENRRLEAEARALQCRRSALDLIEDRVPHAVRPYAATEALLENLPRTGAGDLHEPAFLLLLDQVVWEHRLEGAVAPATNGRTAR